MKSIINDISIGNNNNMKYGAYELKKLYQKYLTKGLIIAIILHCLFISGYLFVMYLEKVRADSEKDKSKRIVDVIEADVQDPPDELPPESPKELALKELSALTPEPVAKRKVTEEIKLKSQEELDDIDFPVSSTGTDDPSKVNLDAEFSGKIEEKKIEEKIEKKEEKKKNDFETFEVEKAPVAVNLGSIKGSMRYPEIARQSGIEGRVVARILVGTDGSVLKLGNITGPEILGMKLLIKL